MWQELKNGPSLRALILQMNDKWKKKQNQWGLQNIFQIASRE
jgi:hypothetical protein